MKNVDQTTSSTDVLSSLEAAHLLGITQELLFSYTRKQPKKNHQNDFSLRHVVRKGLIQFERSELERFDSYLKEPWSGIGDERPEIPTAIETFLRIEGGGQCARCGKGHKVTSAHIIPYAETRSHHHHNLIRLCTGCHAEYDDGLIDRAEIVKIKDRLIAQTRGRLLATMQINPVSRGRVPNPAPVFVGRDKDVVILTKILCDKRSVSVEGAPGIGKTQLLLHALKRLPCQIPTIWIEVEACTNVSDVELALCVTLSTPERPVSSGALSSYLDQLNVRIAFDGVEKLSPNDWDEVNDFFQRLLTTTTTPRFVFSSQIELIGLNIDARFQVQPINEEASMEVLSSTGPILDSTFSEDVADLNWLNAFCDGHALSLQLTAALLRYFKAPSVVVRRIKESGISELKIPGRQRFSPATSLRACLLVSYRVLSQEERSVFWLCSQCPAGCLAVMLEEIFKISNLDTIVAELRRWHLLEVSGSERLARLHSLSPIRAFIAAEWELEQKEAVNLLRIQLVRAFAFDVAVLNSNHIHAGDSAYAIMRFDEDFPNYVNAFRVAVNCCQTDESYLEIVPMLSAGLMVYCFVRRLVKQGYAMMRIGADVALRVGKPRRASSLLVKAFALGRRSRDSKLAMFASEELFKLAADSQDDEIQANARFAQGHVALDEKRWDEALTHLDFAIRHYECLMKGSTDADRVSIRSDLALAIWGKATVYERTQRPAQALTLLKRALIFVKEANDEINLGSILHHIGNCAASCNQPERALEAYLAAATQFHSIGIQEHLSTALSETGHLLIGWDPERPVISFIAEDLLTDGLADIASQVAYTFVDNLNGTLATRMDAIRKTFGMTALSSFSHNHLLREWAAELTDDVLRPALVAIKDGSLERGDEICWMYLDLTLALARTLAQVPTEGDPRRILSDSEVKHYARICYRYFDFGWSAFRPFEWLETYLRRHRGSNSYSADLLKAAAAAAEKSGEPFGSWRSDVRT